MSKRSTIILLVIGTTAVGPWLGCTKAPVRSAAGSGGTAASSSDVPNPQDYLRSTKDGPFGTMDLSSITAPALNAHKSALAQQDVRELDLPGDFNTHVYALDGYQTPGAVIAEPRILLRSSVTGEREQVRESDDGMLVANVSVALVDGMAPLLFTGKGTRSLPAEFLVKNREALIAAVQKALGKPPVFLSDVRCPDSITLRVEGTGEFPVLFKSKLKSCPINTVFPAEIEFKKDEWDGLIAAFSEGRNVEVEAKINLETPLTLDYASFELNKTAVRADFLGRLGKLAEPYSAKQVSDAGQAMVDAIQKSFQLCVPKELFTSFLDGVIRDDLRSAVKPDCPNGVSICFYKGDPVGISGNYTFSVRREEYLGRPLLIDSIAPVSDYLADRQEFMLRALPDNPLLPPKESELSQLFRTVQEGEVAEFKVNELRLGVASFKDPVVTPVAHEVCTQPYSLCQDGRWRCTNPNTENYNCRSVCTGGYDRRCTAGMVCIGCVHWENVCRSYSQVCDQRRVCDRLSAPGRPSLPYRMDQVQPAAPDFAWDCTRFAQNQCDPDKWENHWERVTTWSLPSMTADLQEAAWSPSDWDRVLDGLSVRFSYATDQGSTTVVCPVRALQYRILNPDRLIITFRNTPGCAPFNDQNRKPGYGPTIGLVNQISFPRDFQCGSLTENWQGKRRYVCRLPDGTETDLETTVADDEGRQRRGEPLGIHKIYYPRVELQGSLRMVGSYFESVDPNQGPGNGSEREMKNESIEKQGLEGILPMWGGPMCNHPVFELRF